MRQIGDRQWQAATPDEDWVVRDLVSHVVGEDLWAPPLLAGSTIAEVGDRFDGDVLSADPKAAWAAASARAVQAIGEDGAMGRIVHLSFGDFPGREYALQLFADHLSTRGRGRRGLEMMRTGQHRQVIAAPVAARAETGRAQVALVDQEPDRSHPAISAWRSEQPADSPGR